LKPVLDKRITLKDNFFPSDDNTDEDKKKFTK
jgi:hypothetical protein